MKKNIKLALFAIATACGSIHAMQKNELYYAFIKEEPEKIIRELLENGADPDGDEKDMPPLCSAARHPDDNPLYVKMLLDAGANIEKKDAGQETALFNAVIFGKKGIARFLLIHGANPNTVAGFNSTCLHKIYLCFLPKDSITLAQLLIDSGAKTSLKDSKSKTALECIKEKGRLDLIEAIERHETKKKFIMNLKKPQQATVCNTHFLFVNNN